MSIDEARLAEEFQTITVDVPVDVEAVMTRGRRLRRRRWLDAAGAVAVVVAVGAAVVALAVTAPGFAPAHPGVPTHPGIPTPDTTALSETESMTFRRGGGFSVLATATKSDGTIKVSLDIGAFGTHPAAVKQLEQPDDSKLVAHVVYGDLFVTIAPAGTQVLEVVEDVDFGGASSFHIVDMDRVGVQVGVYVYEGEDAATNVRGVFYQTPGGLAAMSTLGGPAARDCFGFGNDRVGQHSLCAFEASDLDVLGVSFDGSFTSFRLSALPPGGDILNGSYVYTAPQEQPTTDLVVSYAVLPSGARDITLMPDGAGAPQASSIWTLRGVRRDYTMVAAIFLRTGDSKVPALTSVTYINVAGKRVTVTAS